MENNIKNKTFNRRTPKIVLLLISFFLSTFTGENINYAMVLNQHGTKASNSTNQNEFDYTFKVGNKLEGDGQIKLIIEKNEIKGTAVGIGMTIQCNVDFLTKIHGKVNPKRGLEISVDGIGDPIGIPIPGKITFQGPLKGFVHDKKLSLTGKVKIKGALARCAGFKKTEDILVEIPSSYLVKAFKKIQKQDFLAST